MSRSGLASSRWKTACRRPAASWVMCLDGAESRTDRDRRPEGAAVNLRTFRPVLPLPARRNSPVGPPASLGYVATPTFDRRRPVGDAVEIPAAVVPAPLRRVVKTGRRSEAPGRQRGWFRRRMCEDYRAGLSIDRDHDEADRVAGRRVACPTLLLESADDDIDIHGDPTAIWEPWLEQPAPAPGRQLRSPPGRGGVRSRAGTQHERAGVRRCRCRVRRDGAATVRAAGAAVLRRVAAATATTNLRGMAFMMLLSSNGAIQNRDAGSSPLRSSSPYA